MTNEKIIDETIRFVKKSLRGAEGGHDWWHIERVYNTTIQIAAVEPVDNFVCVLAALLHDIADAKFHNGNENAGAEKAMNFLQSLQVNASEIKQVEHIIKHISFRDGIEGNVIYTPELAVVQDADRLDAIGAIGIARAFNYGGYKNREIYNPEIKPDLTMCKEAYTKSNAPSINHFYEKLLLLKDKMNTTTGRKMAEGRHAFMLQYLEHFFEEWKGSK